MSRALMPIRFTTDQAVAFEPAQIHWVSFFSTDDDTQLVIRDGTSSGERIVWDGSTTKYSSGHFGFDPPIKCNRGVYVDCGDDFEAGTICISPIEPD